MTMAPSLMESIKMQFTGDQPEEIDDIDDDEDNLSELPTLELDWNYKDDDVEATNQKAEERKLEVRRRIHEHYPYLDQKQVEFVGVLDDAIDDAIPEVCFPRLRFNGPQLSWLDFLAHLKAPFVTFLVTLSTAIGIALSESSSFAGKIYPFLVTLVAFLASVPAMKGRWDGYYETTSSRIRDFSSNRIEPPINKLEAKATSLVTRARCELDGFLDSIRGELREVQRAKNVVQQIDGSIKIPDVSDLDGYLDGSERQVRSAISDAKSKLDFHELVPWILRSKKRFDLGVVLPVMLVMLGIQLFGTWQTERVIEPTENKWDPVIISGQTFAIAVAQVAFSFFVTRAKRIVGFVNRLIKSTNERVNLLLKDKAGEAFHAILDLAMNHVRERILEIVDYVRQAERLAVGLQSKVHELKSQTDKVTDTVLSIESAVHDTTSIETHEASSWMQRISLAIHPVVESIDHCTAGLINCTGFVQNPDEETTLTYEEKRA